MGHTAAEWSIKVLNKLNDATELDVTADMVFTIGVRPALAQYSIDRPRSAVVDLTPSGQYCALPSAADGWVSDWSDISRIEAPAGNTPPSRLDPGEWTRSRDTADASIEKILLPFTLAAGEKARVFFTAAWPTPGDVAATDLVSDIAFEAVTSLAAALVCSTEAVSSATARQGSLATGFVDGTERARNLLDVAAGLRVAYNTFIGLGTVAGQSGQSVSQRVLRSVKIG